jgi:hypothetical protein
MRRLSKVSGASTTETKEMHMMRSFRGMLTVLVGLAVAAFPPTAGASSTAKPYQCSVSEYWSLTYSPSTLDYAFSDSGNGGINGYSWCKSAPDQYETLFLNPFSGRYKDLDVLKPGTNGTVNAHGALGFSPWSLVSVSATNVDKAMPFTIKGYKSGEATSTIYGSAEVAIKPDCYGNDWWYSTPDCLPGQRLHGLWVTGHATLSVPGVTP